MSRRYTNRLFALDMTKVIVGGVTVTAATIYAGTTFLNRKNPQVPNNTAPQIITFEGRVVPGITPKI